MKAECYFECKGRDAAGQEVLSSAVPVLLYFEQCDSRGVFQTSVKCQYITGGHGQRCFASHPGKEKVGPGVRCPYVTSVGWVEEPRRTYERHIALAEDLKPFL
jgi:hypothetical protein